MSATGTISAVLQYKGAQVWTISPDATVFDAILLMTEKNVGALLVLEGEALLGLISERDYARKVTLKGKSSKQTPVREICSSPLITITPSHTVEEGLRIMTHNRVRHLPILEGGKLVGIVSIGDLVNWTISAQSHTINQLEKYIAGQY